MKTYNSHRQVRAAKIDGVEESPQDGGFRLQLEGGDSEAVSREWALRHRPHPGGYLVKYFDDYTSFCPAEAFERDHTPDDGGFKAPPVAGYNNQTAQVLTTVNGNKAVEEQTLRVLDELAKVPGIDGRWLAIGRTHIEQGWMAANRAIFKPGRVKLAEDTPAQQQDS